MQASLGAMAFAPALEPVLQPGGALTAPIALCGSQQPVSLPSGTAPIPVTVNENSASTVVNLGTTFAAVGGLQHKDGLKLSILGNTNSGLVKATLSEAALSLTYVTGKSGTATITVCATDADGVSVKQTLLITVRPSVAVAPRPLSSAPLLPAPMRPLVTVAPPSR